MALEIERKFLVQPGYKPAGEPHTIRQGYIPTTGEMTVRIRRTDDKAYIALKGRNSGVTRTEYEYPIPVPDAEELLTKCAPPLIDKERYVEKVGAHDWEIDIFHGENEGLVVAEIELAAEDEAFDRPAWLGEEVSGDPRYYNVNLGKVPYSQWKR